LTGGGLAPTSCAGGIDSYSLALPTQAAFCGLTLHTRATQFGAPPFTLSNAQDPTVGS
jgi:hypothetical protein